MLYARSIFVAYCTRNMVDNSTSIQSALKIWNQRDPNYKSYTSLFEFLLFLKNYILKVCSDLNFYILPVFFLYQVRVGLANRYQQMSNCTNRCLTLCP